MENLTAYKLSNASSAMSASNFNGLFSAVAQCFNTLNDIITEWKGSNQNVSYSPQAASNGARCTADLWNHNVGNISIVLSGFVSSDDYWSDASSTIKQKVSAISALNNKSAGAEIKTSDWNELIDNLLSIFGAAETDFGAKRDAAVEARNYWHFGDSMPIVLAASAS